VVGLPSNAKKVRDGLVLSVIVMGEVGLLNHVGFIIEPSRAPRPRCALFDLLPGISLAGLAAARILTRLPYYRYFLRFDA